MAAVHGWQRWRMTVLLGLIVMILVRLVWMQLRHYPLSYDRSVVSALNWADRQAAGTCQWLRAPQNSQPFGPSPLKRDVEGWEGAPQSGRGVRDLWLVPAGTLLISRLLCETDLGDGLTVVGLNQGLFLATVFWAALCVRFATSSWTSATVAATVVLSRGRLLAGLGYLSEDSLLRMIFALWMALTVHHIRTGSTVTMILGAAAVVAGGLFEPAFFVLALPLPLFLLLGLSFRRVLARPMIQRFRSQKGDPDEEGHGPRTQHQSVTKKFGEALRWVLGIEVPTLLWSGSGRPDYRRGGLFQTLKVPYLIWAYHRRVWRKVVWGWIALGVLGGLAILTMKWQLAGGGWPSSLPSMLSSMLHPEAARWPEGFPLAPLTEIVRAFARGLALSLDLHLAISFGVLGISAALSPSQGLPSFWDTVWLSLLAILLLGLASLFMDGVDLLVLNNGGGGTTWIPATGLVMLPMRSFLSWTEPVVLSLAVGGIYNLIEVVDAREAPRIRPVPKRPQVK